MKNNSLGTVSVSNSKRPRARFNLSSDLNTTLDFGSVIPARVHLMLPGSKEVVQPRSLCRLAPMVAPAFARMGLKMYHNFVGMSDLHKNFAPMLAQEPVSRGGVAFVPQQVPSATIRDLSTFILWGAKLTIYSAGTASGVDPDVNNYILYKYTGSQDPGTGAAGSTNTSQSAVLTDLAIATSYSSHGLTNARAILTSLMLFGGQPVTIGTSPNFGRYIPLSNQNSVDFFDIDPTTEYYKVNSKFQDLETVSIDAADVLIPCFWTDSNNTLHGYYLAFRLSSFGKRLRKILIGCGYQIDFSSSQMVSLLPLFAFYKSYFDVFGLTLYNNWESTYAYRFLELADLSSFVNFYSGQNTLWHTSNSALPSNPPEYLFEYFMVEELGATFYTDEQDFVSSHTTSTAVTPSYNSFLSSIDTDVDNVNNGVPHIGDMSHISENTNLAPSSTYVNGHARINSVLHGQLDSELLKRLYRWTNRNTIAGRRIAELLRAQGLGAYVDECKSNYIGYHELEINVDDVVSTSDTFSAANPEGKILGEYGGRGIGAGQNGSFVYEATEHGFWITLMVMVPKGGYAESLDPTLLAMTKWTVFQPEFDSLGMEFDPKFLVQGSMPCADYQSADGSLSDSFGLAPRFFRWKFGRNQMNGDFNLRSTRDTYLPYSLDRIIDVGDRIKNREVYNTSGYTEGIIQKTFKPNSLPVAGNVWRYPTRYNFLSRYNRIFFNSGSNAFGNWFGAPEKSQVLFEFFGNQYDNFMLHTIFDVQYFAPMLPVEDSFETYDDDNSVNGSMLKA